MSIKACRPSSVVPSDAAHVLRFYRDSLRRQTATDSTSTMKIFKHARHPRETPIISRFIKKSKNLFHTPRSRPTGIITGYSLTCYDRTANNDNLPRLSVYSSDQNVLEIPRCKKLALHCLFPSLSRFLAPARYHKMSKIFLSSIMSCQSALVISSLK